MTEYDKICKALLELAKRVDKIEQALVIQNDINQDLAKALQALSQKIELVSEKGIEIPVKRSDLH